MAKDEARQLTYTVAEAQRLLRIGRNQTYEALERGDIAAIRIGKSWRVLKEPLDRRLAGEAV